MKKVTAGAVHTGPGKGKGHGKRSGQTVTTAQRGELVKQSVEERDREIMDCSEQAHQEFIGALNEKEGSKQEWQRASARRDRYSSKVETLRKQLLQEEAKLKATEDHVAVAKERVDHAFKQPDLGLKG